MWARCCDNEGHRPTLREIPKLLRDKLTASVRGLAPRAWGQGHAFWLAFALLGSLALGMIWIPPLLPLVDSPTIAYSGMVFHALHTGDTFYASWHDLRPEAVSHLAYYHLFSLLLYVLTPAVATKVMVSGIVLSIPLSLRALFTAMGRSPWLSLAGFGMAFNFQLQMGYLPFCLSFPVFVLALAWIERNADRMRVGRTLLLFAVLVLSPYVHLFLTPVLFLVAAVWVATSQRRWQHVLIHFGVLLLAGLAVLALVPFPKGKAPKDLSRAMDRVPLSEHLDRFDHNFLNWTIDGWDALSTPLFFLALIVTLSLCAGLATTSRPEGWWRRACAYRLELVAGAFFLGFMLAPTNIRYPWVAWSIDARFPVFGGLLAAGIPRFVPGTMRQALRLTPLALFSLFHLVSLVGPFAAFARETEGLLVVSRAIPPESRILPLFSHEYMRDEKRWGFEGFHPFVNQHLVRWSAVYRRGVQPYTFCLLPFHPIACRKLLPVSGPRNPMAGVGRHLKHYDYVVHYANVDNRKKRERALFERRKLELVSEAGRWTLWRVESPKLRRGEDRPFPSRPSRDRRNP